MCIIVHLGGETDGWCSDETVIAKKVDMWP